MWFRVYRWLDRRLQLESIRRALRWSAPASASPTLGTLLSVGRLALVLLFLLVVSGATMTLFYNPTPARAFESIQYMQEQVPLGWLIRGIHRWSALLLMAVVVLHMLRVLLMGSYRFPRDVNWWLGLVLLPLVYLFAATGYLLRWDIKALALMLLVKENLQDMPLVGDPLVTLVLGGTELGIVPLSRGYAFHIWFLPLLLALLLGVHLLIIWRQGLAPLPSFEQSITVSARAARRLRFLPGLLLLVFILILTFALPRQELVTGPTDRSAWPQPDWVFVFYLLPFWFFSGPWRLVGSTLVPALFFLLLAWLPRLSQRQRMTFGGMVLSIVAVAAMAWLFAQTGRIAAAVPTQGCLACHKPEMVGGAPVAVDAFREFGTDWLIEHLQDPPRSLSLE